MKETWYKIKKDEKYCAEVLDIFCGLHDYMIKDMNYDYQKKILVINFRYDDDDCSTEEITKGKDYNWVEADEIHFAWLDKNNEIIPLTEGRLNPTWRTLNYETGKYEDIRRHFDVFEADE